MSVDRVDGSVRSVLEPLREEVTNPKPASVPERVGITILESLISTGHRIQDLTRWPLSVRLGTALATIAVSSYILAGHPSPFPTSEFNCPAGMQPQAKTEICEENYGYSLLKFSPKPDLGFPAGSFRLERGFGIGNITPGFEVLVNVSALDDLSKDAVVGINRPAGLVGFTYLTNSDPNLLKDFTKDYAYAYVLPAIIGGEGGLIQIEADYVSIDLKRYDFLDPETQEARIELGMGIDWVYAMQRMVGKINGRVAQTRVSPEAIGIIEKAKPFKIQAIDLSVFPKG